MSLMDFGFIGVDPQNIPLINLLVILAVSLGFTQIRTKGMDLLMAFLQNLLAFFGFVSGSPKPVYAYGNSVVNQRNFNNLDADEINALTQTVSDAQGPAPGDAGGQGAFYTAIASSVISADRFSGKVKKMNAQVIVKPAPVCLNAMGQRSPLRK